MSINDMSFLRCKICMWMFQNLSGSCFFLVCLIAVVNVNIQVSYSDFLINQSAKDNAKSIYITDFSPAKFRRSSSDSGRWISFPIPSLSVVFSSG